MKTTIKNQSRSGHFHEDKAILCQSSFNLIEQFWSLFITHIHTGRIHNIRRHYQLLVCWPLKNMMINMEFVLNCFEQFILMECVCLATLHIATTCSSLTITRSCRTFIFLFVNICIQNIRTSVNLVLLQRCQIQDQSETDWSQIGHIRDFLNQISVYLAWRVKCTEYNRKISCICPIIGQYDPLLARSDICGINGMAKLQLN